MANKGKSTATLAGVFKTRTRSVLFRLAQKRNILEIYVGKASGLLCDSISRHITVVDVPVLLEMSRKHGRRQAVRHSSHKNALFGNMSRWGVAATIIARGRIASATV